MTRLAALTVLLASAAWCPAQAVWTWQQPTNKPLARDATRAAWDHVRQEVLVFGGNGRSPQNDTWSWNGTNWTQLTPTTTPTERVWHAMVSDSVRQCIVVFGGSDNLGVSNETWEWDGLDWSMASPTNSPSARAFPAMAYDEANNEVVLFGGFPASTPLADTWTWNGVNWTPRAPSTSPAARGWHGMAYDPVRAETVLFGGYVGGASPPFADTWVWNGNDWSQKQPLTNPNGQMGHAMVFDASRQRVVMSLGFERPLAAQTTWEWDGSDWQATTSGSGPIGNWDNGLAYDEVREQVVHFGGRLGGSGNSDQTWIHASTSPAQFSPLGSGCAGSVGVPVLEADGRPWIGDTMAATVEPVPAGQFTVFVFGLSDTTWLGRSLPTSLAPEGMPGCTGFVSADASLLIANSGTTASWSSPVGTNLGLVGLDIFAQCVVLDAAATTAFPAVVSNALHGVVGLR